jgi:site-specific recombinase XerD
METLPAVVDGTTTLTNFEGFLKSALDFADNDTAESTRLAYASDLRDFLAWCGAHDREALPASIDTVAAYLAACVGRGLSASTLDRRAAAIAFAHRKSGHQPPTSSDAVKSVLGGIRREIGSAVERKAPATAAAITKMIRRIPETSTGARDRALLLVGFAAALRRAELVALDVADLERTSEGVIVHIRRSKTDQEGEGHTVPIARGGKLKVIEALEAWLAAGSIEAGPVFRRIRKGGAVGDRLTDQSVALIVKKYAAAAGLNPELFAGHSLRAGFVTSALEHGADLLKIMDVTRHREVKTLQAYDRRAKLFKNTAGRGFL